jgi:hypothetical protein
MTNLFQAREFVFFGALKKLKPTAVSEFDDGPVNPQITQLLEAYEHAAISATIRDPSERQEWIWMSRACHSGFESSKTDTERESQFQGGVGSECLTR